MPGLGAGLGVVPESVEEEGEEVEEEEAAAAAVARKP